ncbi:hypothetical protein GLA29479_4496 [Lysobacter antibioticus]|nr:hypothetical protein GLA29479_4496 [Lysobacter antibioticus]
MLARLEEKHGATADAHRESWAAAMVAARRADRRRPVMRAPYHAHRRTAVPARASQLNGYAAEGYGPTNGTARRREWPAIRRFCVLGG